MTNDQGRAGSVSGRKGPFVIRHSVLVILSSFVLRRRGRVRGYVRRTRRLRRLAASRLPVSAVGRRPVQHRHGGSRGRRRLGAVRADGLEAGAGPGGTGAVSPRPSAGPAGRT